MVLAFLLVATLAVGALVGDGLDDGEPEQTRGVAETEPAAVGSGQGAPRTAGPERPAEARIPLAEAPHPQTMTARHLVEPPQRLRIPLIGVDAPITTVGITDDAVMEVPTDGGTVGWYRFSQPPGRSGLTLLAAHVTYRGEAGAFFALRHLSSGDAIALETPDRIFSYVVTETHRFDASVASLATLEAEDDLDVLMLITCDGIFDPETRSYDLRLVVVAERTP